MKVKHCDFLIIGSGLAGLVYALKVSPFGKVLICSKSDVRSTNTAMAQGGVAAVMSADDAFDLHIRDTLEAGAGLCRERIVRLVVEQAPERINELLNWGVKFDLRDKDGSLSLTREGGHSQRRILHIQDHTGKDLHEQLLSVAKNDPNIEFLEQTLTLDLILNHDVDRWQSAPAQVLGCYTLSRNSLEIGVIRSKHTVLATGGAGKAYLYTSNWSGATGDGIAMAYRAGARVANMEMMQFHPTCLYDPRARNFLITEALRGEGAELINSDGKAFMSEYHPKGSLAPRDIVARSIDAEMKQTGSECVYLDARFASPEVLRSRFPSIYKECLHYGVDLTTTPIPVVPAAHYLCGGILTNEWGETDIQGLYAIGETACTGLHGANRLASNSLLECLVFAHNAAERSIRSIREIESYDEREAPALQFDRPDANELVMIPHIWDEIRRLMWNYVGIVRTDKRLRRAWNRLILLREEIEEYYSRFHPTPDLIELRSICIVAELSVRCAIERPFSVGIHYNLDRPHSINQPVTDTIVSARR